MRLPYFAYGSNLLRERLISRCPKVRYAGRGSLVDHQLVFDKVSSDGSGKCAFKPALSHSVYGVLWSISSDELSALDRLEGLGRGYERLEVRVSQLDSECDALTYRATERRQGLQPYDWYLALVIAGAEQQGLPDAYCSHLRGEQFKVDGNVKRKRRLEALGALEAANMLTVLSALSANTAQ